MRELSHLSENRSERHGFSAVVQHGRVEEQSEAAERADAEVDDEEDAVDDERDVLPVVLNLQGRKQRIFFTKREKETEERELERERRERETDRKGDVCQESFTYRGEVKTVNTQTNKPRERGGRERERKKDVFL